MEKNKLELAQALASHIAELTEEQQEQIMHGSSIDSAKLASNTRSEMLSALDSISSPLKMARRKIDMLEAGKKSRISDKITDPKAYLIDLMIKGVLPNDLTLAFREGKDLSDDDLRSMIDDLEDLDDDQDGEH